MPPYFTQKSYFYKTPFFVFYLTDKILLMRPGGHGETSLLKKNPLRDYCTVFVFLGNS